MSLIGKSIGNYRITAKLGEGGMGAVYLGEHPLIGKRVAVKVLLDELAAKEDIVSRFFNEAKAVNDIGHQNIVDIVDFGKSPDGAVYFIMEFLDGESLSGRLQRTGMAFPETLHVMKQCCSALSASHAKGIVHRDLKPENIYLLQRGTDKNFTKLLDFGIAKLTGHGSQSSKTRTGSVIGTPAYMSPEQCEGKGQIDHRSDIYSLGCVMFEMLTGRVPFVGEGFGEVLVMHIVREVEKPSSVNAHVTPELEAIVMHALEKDRNRRFQTMEEFAAALEDPAAHLAAYRQLPNYAPSGKHSGATMFLDDSAPAARGPITQSQPRPTTLSGAAAEVTVGGGRRSRAPIYATAAVALLAAVGGVGFVVLRSPKSATTATQPEETPTVTPAPIVDETVIITVKSDPPGARVVRADQGDVGATPIDLKVKKGDPSFDIQLRLEGYKLAKSEITTEKTKEISVGLAKIEVAVPPPVVAEPTPPPAHTASTSGKPKHSHKKSADSHSIDPETELLQPAFLK